jgi:isopenicillin-N epimerase
MMLRDQFLLDSDIVFLNHGSFCCPRPVFDVCQNWQRQLERQPVQFLGVELDGHLFKARALAD